MAQLGYLPWFLWSVVVISIVYCQAPECKNTDHCIPPGKDVMFGLGSDFETGKRPGVAMVSNDRTVVFVHQEKEKIKFLAGKITKMVIAFTTNETELCGGTEPDVAGNTVGDIVVTFRRSEKLFYMPGSLANSQIDMGKEVYYNNSGERSSVALVDDKTVLLAHVRDNKIKYRIGKLKGPDSGIDLGPEQELPVKGKHPRVAMNNGKQVVVVYSDAEKVCYIAGTLDGNKINWGFPKTDIDNGDNPSVAINDDNFVIIVYQGPGKQEVTSISGPLDPGKHTIQLGHPQQFDNGEFPAVAANNLISIQVHEGIGFMEGMTKAVSDGVKNAGKAVGDGVKSAGKKLGKLFGKRGLISNDQVEYSVSLVHDRSRWMELSPEIQSRQLWEISLPATHDTGTYDLIDDRAEKCGQAPSILSGKVTKLLAHCQDYNVLDQLRGGVRMMDLRPYFWTKDNKFHTYHDNINKEPVDDQLTHLKQFLSSTKKELVVLLISHFCKYNAEKIPDLYDKMVKLVNNILGPFLYKKDWSLKTTFQEFTAGGSKVLLIFDDPYVAKIPAGTGFWPKQKLNYAGNFSNTESLDKMNEKQLEQFKNKEGGKPEELYRLSYTLTFNPGSGDKWGDIGKTLKQLTQPASKTLAQFIRQHDYNGRINIIYTDFFEEARSPDVAVWINRDYEAENRKKK